MVFPHIVILIEHGFVGAAAQGLIHVQNELGKARGKVVDEFVGQRAQAGGHVRRQLSVMMLLVANRAQQIAHAHAIVGAEFLQVVLQVRAYVNFPVVPENHVGAPLQLG